MRSACSISQPLTGGSPAVAMTRTFLGHQRQNAPPHITSTFVFLSATFISPERSLHIQVLKPFAQVLPVLVLSFMEPSWSSLRDPWAMISEPLPLHRQETLFRILATAGVLYPSTGTCPSFLNALRAPERLGLLKPNANPLFSSTFCRGSNAYELMAQTCQFFLDRSGSSFGDRY